jgi:hypothetical protein
MIGTVGPVGVYNELRLEEVPEFFLGDKEDVRGEG